MMSELKRRSLCGGNAQLTYNTYGSHYVQRDSVSCSIKPVTWIYTAEDKAVEAWNKMVTDEEYIESIYMRKEYGE